MSTYGTMRSRIADELHRTDLNTQINRAIVSAIATWETEPLWFNEAFSTFTTVAGQLTYSAADASLTDLVKIRSIRLDVSTSREALTEWTWAEFVENNVSTSQQSVPDYYAYVAEKLLLFPVPNATYTGQIVMVRRLPEISLSATDNATNAWMTHAEELIRQRAKALVRIDNLENETAKAEALQMMALGSTCLSVLEKAAFDRLKMETASRTTGRLVATKF